MSSRAPKQHWPTRKHAIARGYGALDERCFMPIKFHRRCIHLAGQVAGLALNLGCGPGRRMHALREQHPQLRIVGCDLSYGLCSKAQARNSGTPVIAAMPTSSPFTTTGSMSSS